MSPLIRLTGATQQQRLLFAAQIAPRRKALDMTQQELADAAGTTRKTIGNIERGSHAPQADVLARIFDVLDIPTEETSSEPEDVRGYTAMLSTLLAAVPAEKRLEVVNQMSLIAASAVGGNVTGLPFSAPDDVEDDFMESGDDVYLRAVEDHAPMAANRGGEKLHDDQNPDAHNDDTGA